MTEPPPWVVMTAWRRERNSSPRRRVGRLEDAIVVDSAHPTHGVRVDDFHEIGKIIAAALTPRFDAARDDLAEHVTAIADRYPLYASLPAGAPVAAS